MAPKILLGALLRYNDTDESSFLLMVIDVYRENDMECFDVMCEDGVIIKRLYTLYAGEEYELISHMNGVNA